MLVNRPVTDLQCDKLLEKNKFTKQSDEEEEDGEESEDEQELYYIAEIEFCGKYNQYTDTGVCFTNIEDAYLYILDKNKYIFDNVLRELEDNDVDLEHNDSTTTQKLFLLLDLMNINQHILNFYENYIDSVRELVKDHNIHYSLLANVYKESKRILSCETEITKKYEAWCKNLDRIKKYYAFINISDRCYPAECCFITTFEIKKIKVMK